ncbi:CocE/NonD family hydrolase [Sphingopyxis sp.]|jgi:hypothetical protein|uniref:CocE/NonD family hydrolase n=1 Tax=Sphingopyxis sp. TaxID=1908224 RepID=UPI002DF3C364|nr:CocE/NonD family hydrolase [Sphingopyxis sp.]
MRDGVALATDLWLPDDAQPVAAILIRTPYDKSRLASDFIRPQQLVESGFAVAVQDTRGRFASGGKWTPLDWEQEGLDGFDSIEWLASQPWCDGNVGMAGTSYAGIVQFAAAALSPPALRAIAPTMTGVAQGEIAETGGAFWLDHLFGWLCAVGIDWALENGRPDTANMFAGWLSEPAPLHESHPVSAAPIFALPDFPVTHDRLSRDPITPAVSPASVAMPILAIGGWFDMYLRASIAAGTEGTSPRHLVLGPWAHSGQPGPTQGDLNFGLTGSAAGAGMAAQHIAYFDRYLREGGSEVPPVRFFEMPRAGWRTASRWPVNAERRLLSPREGRLVQDGEGGSARLEYRFDDPVRTVGGRTMPLAGLTPGPLDQRAASRHAGVSLAIGDQLAEPILVAGQTRIVFDLDCDRPGCDVFAKLLDIYPDGRELLVTDGHIRVSTGDTSASTRWPRRAEIALADTAWRFEAGHRLGLLLQSSNFPHFDRNPLSDTSARLSLDGIVLDLPIGNLQ